MPSIKLYSFFLISKLVGDLERDSLIMSPGSIFIYKHSKEISKPEGPAPFLTILGPI